MNNFSHILVHYNEIALKGRNRPFFENALMQNIKNSFINTCKADVRRMPGRILVSFKKATDAKNGVVCLRNIFGISSFSPALIAKSELADIKKKALKTLFSVGKTKSFKVATRREYKQFVKNSMEVSSDVGAYLLKNSGVKVDVKRPATVVSIEILKDKSYIYSQKIKGLGGLPVGVSGKVISLISGGIDSPVASYLMMKRGALPEFIHFHSYPHTDKASIEKVSEILYILSKYKKGLRVYFAPIIDFQKEVLKKADARYRVILYRRLMYRVAEELAGQIGAKAICSGDSLGQVASQTLENMGVIGYGIDLPILRPLVGFDKEDIIKIARDIGTFDLSTEPHGDCCSIFLPQNPATKSRIEDILREEKKIGMVRWVEKCLALIEAKIVR